jgi:hypothetical protein
MTDKENLNTEDAAKYLGYSQGTLENWRMQNTGPRYYKPLGRVFYFKDDLDLWIKGEEAKK